MRTATFETDVIPTSAGDLAITFIGHGSLMMTFNGKTIHIDPVSSEADYASLPKADIVFLTHEHSDHLDIGSPCKTTHGQDDHRFDRALRMHKSKAGSSCAMEKHKPLMG